MRKPNLLHLLKVIGIRSLSPLRVQVLFLGVYEVPFNDGAILLWDLLALTASESVVLVLYRLLVGHTKAYSGSAL